MAHSILQDGDYNLINQVENRFKWLLTKTYYFPSLHSEIQTPSLLFLGLIEYLPRAISKGVMVKKFHISAILLHLWCLFMGFKYTKMGIRVLGYNLSMKIFLVFLLSTSMFYFSFIYLTVLEVFAFSLTGFVFYNMALLYKERIEEISPILFGLSIALLLICKSSYVFLFMGGILLSLVQISKLNYKYILKFVCSIFIVVISFYLNNTVKFGEFILINSYFSIIVDPTIENVINTIRYGYMGIGGLFATNPLFLVSFILFHIPLLKKELKIDHKDIVFYSTLFLWIYTSIFQTIFLIGSVVDDHYVGRLSLVSVPVMLFSLARFSSKKIESSKVFNIVSISLIFFQFISLLNFMTIHLNAHYGFASRKVVESFQEFKELYVIFLQSYNETVLYDVKYILCVSFTLTFLYYIILKFKVTVKTMASFFIVGTSVSLLIFSIMNFSNSQSNVEMYLKNKTIDLKSSVVGKGGNIYIYNYVLDALQTHYLEAKSDSLKKKILMKRSDYIKSVKKEIVKSTPEFNEELKNLGLKISLFFED